MTTPLGAEIDRLQAKVKRLEWMQAKILEELCFDAEDLDGYLADLARRYEDRD